MPIKSPIGFTRSGCNSFAEMTDLPQALRMQLADNFSFDNIDTLRVLGSKDTTQKFLFRLRDGNLIESVLIPASPALYGSPSDRRTICISTQVGCAYGCKFCASGLDGWKRNLRADEIVNQIMMVEEASGERIDNIVFMGMGEPLANYDNLMRAIQIINAPWGIGIGARHITISDEWIGSTNSPIGRSTLADSTRGFIAWRQRRCPQPDHADKSQV